MWQRRTRELPLSVDIHLSGSCITSDISPDVGGKVTIDFNFKNLFSHGAFFQWLKQGRTTDLILFTLSVTSISLLAHSITAVASQRCFAGNLWFNTFIVLGRLLHKTFRESNRGCHAGRTRCLSGKAASVLWSAGRGGTGRPNGSQVSTSIKMHYKEQYRRNAIWGLKH